MAAYRVHAHGSWARALAHAGHVLGRSPQASGAAGGRLPQLIVAVRKAALVAAVALPRLHELLAQLGLVHGHVRRLQQHPCQPQTFGNTTTDTAWKNTSEYLFSCCPCMSSGSNSISTGIIRNA